MELIFLNQSQARLEYQSTDYFDQMDSQELVDRLIDLTGKSESENHRKTLILKIKEVYFSAVLNFNDHEKKIIKYYFGQLLNILISKATLLIPRKIPILLIKLSNGVDWNYPYTINHAIILPEYFVNNAINKYNQSIHNNALRRTITIEIINTLCHELIHVIQRNKNIYPDHCRIFNFIYQKFWGFIKINKLKIKFYKSYQKKFYNTITNPDGYNYQWVIPLFNSYNQSYQYFMPILTKGEKNQHKGLLVKVILTAENFYLTDEYIEINQSPTYNQKFYGLSKQLYHPNEILAHLISDYITKNIIYFEKSETVDYFNFYRFINKHLIGHKI